MSRDINKPNYYSILPANVRYDNRLSDGQKILYSELTALANTHGYAFPSNEYLATLYGVSEKTIQRNINTLKKYNYIEIDIEITAKGSIRKIYIYGAFIPVKTDEIPVDKNVHDPVDKNVPKPVDKNVHRYIRFNNTRNNITSISNSEYNDINNKQLDIDTNLDTVFTLSLVKQIYKNNDFKKFNINRFFNHYELLDWIYSGVSISNEKQVVKLMEMWEASERSNPDDVNKPEWIDKYMVELEEMN